MLFAVAGTQLELLHLLDYRQWQGEEQETIKKKLSCAIVILLNLSVFPVTCAVYSDKNGRFTASDLE